MSFKNLVMAALCFALVLGSVSSAVAGGPRGKSKRAPKGCFLFENLEQNEYDENDELVEAGTTFAVYVKPVGTELPETVGELREQLFYVEPDDSYKTERMRIGEYVIAYGDMSVLEGVDDDTELTEDLFSEYVMEEFTTFLRPGTQKHYLQDNSDDGGEEGEEGEVNV